MKLLIITIQMLILLLYLPFALGKQNSTPSKIPVSVTVINNTSIYKYITLDICLQKTQDKCHSIKKVYSHSTKQITLLEGKTYGASFSTKAGGIYSCFSSLPASANTYTKIKVTSGASNIIISVSIIKESGINTGLCIAIIR